MAETRDEGGGTGNLLHHRRGASLRELMLDGDAAPGNDPMAAT